MIDTRGSANGLGVSIGTISRLFRLTSVMRSLNLGVNKSGNKIGLRQSFKWKPLFLCCFIFGSKYTARDPWDSHAKLKNRHRKTHSQENSTCGSQVRHYPLYIDEFVKDMERI